MRMGKRGCLALFLLCAAGLVWLFGTETVRWREPILLWPEAVAVGPGLDELVPYAGPLELEYTLPAWEDASRPTLEIRGQYNAAAELRLDGAPLWEIPAGLGLVYLTLPGDFAGKTLTLATEKRADDAVPFLYLPDTAILEEQVRADTSLRAFPAAAFAVVFLLTLGLFLYGWAEGTRPWPVLLLCAAALGQTVYFYLENSPLDLLPPALYGLVLYQTHALLFAAPPLYLLMRMKKWRKVFAPFAVLPALVYWVAAGFQTVVPLFSSVAARAGVLFCLTIAALIVCAALEVRDGSPVFRLFLLWLGGCAGVIALAWAVSAAQAGTLAATLEMFLREPLF